MHTHFSPANYRAIPEPVRLQGARRMLVMVGSGIGDALLSLPALACLKQAYPQAQMTAIASPQSAQALQGNPYTQRILPYDSRYSRPRDLLRLLAVLAGERFDLCLSFGNRAPYRRFTRLARAPLKVGRDEQCPSRVYTLTDPHPCPRNTLHEVERDLRLASLVAQVEDGYPMPQVNLTVDERSWAEEFRRHRLAPGQMLVCLHPGGSAAYKRWPVEYYTELCGRLAARAEIKVIVLYGPGEEQLAAVVRAGVSTEVTILQPTSVRQLIMLLSAADLFICNDSGPMHAAAALGIPLVAIFGGTDYRRWSPVSPRARVLRCELDCYPCRPVACPNEHACLHNLPVQWVWEAARDAGKEHHRGI